MLDLQKLNSEKVSSPPLICVYGSPGIGKTAFSVGTSGPDYKIGRDNHILMNLDSRGADRLSCKRLFGKPVNGLPDIKDAFQALAEQKHSFTWLVIDDLTTAEEIFVQEACKEFNVDNLKKVEYGKGYELARSYWTLFFEMIRQLQEEKDIGVILIGHTKIDTLKDPMTDSYSRHDLQLSKQSKEIVKKAVDLIAFARKKVSTKTGDAGFGKKEFVAVGESQRVITFAPDLEGFDSKDRFGLPAELPLDWSEFETALFATYEQKKSNKK